MTLDHALELWARWVISGGHEQRGFQSVIHMMMVTQCVFSGGGKPAGIPADGIEADIEAALLALRQSDMPAANAVRVEYMRQGTQLQKAMSLQLTLRTYRKHLQKGRAALLRHLAERRGGQWAVLFHLSTKKLNKV